MLIIFGRGLQEIWDFVCNSSDAGWWLYTDIHTLLKLYPGKSEIRLIKYFKDYKKTVHAQRVCIPLLFVIANATQQLVQVYLKQLSEARKQLQIGLPNVQFRFNSDC